MGCAGLPLLWLLNWANLRKVATVSAPPRHSRQIVRPESEFSDAHPESRRCRMASSPRIRAPGDRVVRAGQEPEATRELQILVRLSLGGAVLAGVTPRPYLTRCIYQLVLEGELPRKTVDMIFSLVIVNNKLAILWGC